MRILTPVRQLVDGDRLSTVVRPCKGIQFDGSTGYLSIQKGTTMITPSEFTIMFWLKLNNYPSSVWTTPVVKCTNSGLVKNWPFGVVVYNSGQLGFGFGDGTNYNFLVTAFSLLRNVFYFIVARVSDLKVQIYANKKLLGQINRTIDPLTNDHPIWIARGYSGYLLGVIAKLAFYDRALTDTEINDAVKTYPSDYLFLIDEIQGSIAPDKANNGFDADVIGNVTNWSCAR